MKSPGHNRYDAGALLLVVTFGFTAVAAASPTKHLAHPVSLPDVEQPTLDHLPTAAAALEKVLRIPARVIAVGEFHQTPPPRPFARRFHASPTRCYRCWLYLFDEASVRSLSSSRGR
jgi:hypothetical protein